MAIGIQSAPRGGLSIVHRAAERRRVDLVRDDLHGHYRPGRAGLLLKHRVDGPTLHQRVLAWLRDHVDPNIPRAYYRAVLGHDLHIAVFAALYVRHLHVGERDPFTGELGWLENVGRVSQGKVTTAFRDFEAGQLVTESALYGDFKYHEVGTSNTAEANTQTALTTSTGIARATGNQTNPTASTYQTVATITADGSETWQEHGLFNASSSGTMMDRSLISPTVAVNNLDVVEFTYILTKNAES